MKGIAAITNKPETRNKKLVGLRTFLESDQKFRRSTKVHPLIDRYKKKGGNLGASSTATDTLIKNGKKFASKSHQADSRKVSNVR